MFKSLWLNLLHWGLFIVLRTFAFHSRQVVLLKFWVLGIQNKWHDKRSRCHSQTFPGDTRGSPMEVPLLPSLPAPAHGVPLKHLLQLTLWANGCLQGMMWKVPEKLPPRIGPTAHWLACAERASLCLFLLPRLLLSSFNLLVAPCTFHAVKHLQAFALIPPSA